MVASGSFAVPVVPLLAVPMAFAAAEIEAFQPGISTLALSHIWQGRAPPAA
jgi:hypothetical protein